MTAIPAASSATPASKPDPETIHWMRALAKASRPGADGSAKEVFEIGSPTEIAAHLHEVLRKDKLMFDLGEIWRYRHDLGIWDMVPAGFLRALVADLDGVAIPTAKGSRPLSVSTSFAKDTIEMLATLIGAERDNRRFSSAPSYGLGFQNGFLTVLDGVARLLPHSPDNLCRFAYDFAYTPGAPHPRLDKFFEACFRGENAEAQRALPQQLQEFVGACLFGVATRYEKILMLTGEGGNGKSQFLTIARSALPPGSIATLPPQKWGGDFEVYALAGKLANFVDEIPEREISVGAVFKKIISGQPTYANRKYREGVDFEPIAGHIFSANTLPGTSDASEGFFRRILIVPFDSKPLPHQVEIDIGAKIVAVEQRAIVSWAVQGYLRLLTQGAFTEVRRIQERTAAWRTEADGVRMFLFAAYESHPTAPRFSIESLYKMYELWCDTTKHMSLARHKFTRRAKETKLVLKDDLRLERGFAWNRERLDTERALMGEDAPDWGAVRDVPDGTYRRSNKTDANHLFSPLA